MSYLDDYLDWFNSDTCCLDDDGFDYLHSPGPNFVGPHYQLMGPPEDIPF